MNGPEVILCNACGKRMSAKGINIRVAEDGEYQVQYFTCIHCGKKYQITTTDTKQRELLAEAKAEWEKRAQAIKLKFRKETIMGHWKKAKGIERKLEERAKELREVGEKILHPEEGQHGQENGQGGASGIQTH